MRTILITLSIFFTFHLAGCNSGPDYSYKFEKRKISIATDPAGADIYQIGPFRQQSNIMHIPSKIVHNPPTGHLLGNNPLKDQSVAVITSFKGCLSPGNLGPMVSKLDMVTVRIEKEGYKTSQKNLSTDPDETVEHIITLEKE